MAKIRVLTFLEYFSPGYKYGGPTRSVANLIENLGDEVDFMVLTRDRDFRETQPYANIPTLRWLNMGKAKACYLPPEHASLSGIRRIVNQTDFDLMYMNSLFSPRFTIYPLLLRRLRLIKRTPVILAPRGELNPNALAIKSGKKRIFLTVAKALGLYKDVVWQASSRSDEEKIKAVFGDISKIMIAPNLPSIKSYSEATITEKKPGELRVIFLGRISEMKNLLGALKIIQECTGKIDFDIYGPIDDKDYWVQCENIVKKLQDNIRAEYKGTVEPDKIAETLRKYHLLFLPTLGENYGHVIIEALGAGLPVLISDKTPWRNLEALGIGWDIPLEQPEAFKSIIAKCVK